MFTAIGQE